MTSVPFANVVGCTHRHPGMLVVWRPRRHARQTGFRKRNGIEDSSAELRKKFMFMCVLPADLEEAQSGGRGQRPAGLLPDLRKDSK